MSVEDVAEWMKDAVEEDYWLDQAGAAECIADDFGDEYVYTNENGNLAIDSEVLDAFRDLTEDTVVWVKASRAWRLREEDDPEGRQV